MKTLEQIKQTNVQHLINQHYLCIEILEAIQLFRKYIKCNEDSLNGFGGIFPDLVNKYNHKIEICNKCIERLYLRYYNVLYK